jgi:hypothetical protein
MTEREYRCWIDCLVGKITPKGDHYWVEVFGVWGGQKNSNPDVVPELAFENGQ